MIRATPNSVRFDQVNKVSYRFQALHFQSDVLEALVSNSPPLQRRDRASSSPTSAKGKQVHPSSDKSSGPNPETSSISSSSKGRLSLSDSEASEQPDKISTGSPTVRRKSGLPRNVLVVPRTTEITVSSASEERLSTMDLEEDDRIRSPVHDRIPSIDTIDEALPLSEEDDMLDQKTKEELKSMVVSLQRELVETKRRESLSPRNGIKLPFSTTPRAASPLDRYRQSQSLGSVTRSLTSHVKELENEVNRAQTVASRFQEELTILKSRLDLVISHCQTMQKELVVNESKEGGSSMLRFGISDVEDDPSIKKLKEISGI